MPDSSRKGQHTRLSEMLSKRLSYHLNSKPYLRLFRVFPGSIKKRAALTLVLISVSGILEIFSLGIAITLLSDFVSSGDGKQSFMQISILQEHPRILCIAALLLFILKSFFGFAVSSNTYSLTTSAKKYLQDRVFTRLTQTYLTYLHLDSTSHYLRLIIADCNSVEGRFLVPVFVLIGEIVPSTCVAAVLVWYSPKDFIISVMVLALSGTYIYLTTQKRLVCLGAEQQESESAVVKSIQLVNQGLPEITIYGLTVWARGRFLGHTLTGRFSVLAALRIGLMPRLAFEVALYTTILIIIAIDVVSGVPSSTTISKITIFLVAATRLLPSTNKILTHLQSLKYSRKPVLSIVECIEDGMMGRRYPKCVRKTRSADGFVIEASDISIGFGNNEILSKFSFSARSGEHVVISGKSGSGKTTLLKVLLGLVIPVRGVVFYQGEPLANSRHLYWRDVSYVSQKPFVYDAPLLDNVFLGYDNITDHELAEATMLIRLFGMGETVSLKRSLGEFGDNISGGQAQRIAIIRALLRKPKILFLDEATSALDNETQKIVFEHLKSSHKDMTVISVTHRYELLGYADRTVTL